MNSEKLSHMQQAEEIDQEDEGRDELEEMIAEFTAKDPKFPYMVQGISRAPKADVYPDPRAQAPTDNTENPGSTHGYQAIHPCPYGAGEARPPPLNSPTLCCQSGKTPHMAAC